VAGGSSNDEAVLNLVELSCGAGFNVDGPSLRSGATPGKERIRGTSEDIGLPLLTLLAVLIASFVATKRHRADDPRHLQWTGFV